MAKRGFNIAKAAKKSVARNIDLSKEVLMKRGMTAKQAVTYRRAVRNERRNVARKFYKDNTNWPDSKIEAHLHGIDYDKPVIVDKIPPSGKKEVTVYQYRKLDATGRYEPGNYFTLDANATPSELGIADTFTMNVTKAPDGVPQQLGLPFPKEKYVGTVSSEVPCLRSISRRIEDTWSMAGERIFTEGGGEHDALIGLAVDEVDKQAQQEGKAHYKDKVKGLNGGHVLQEGGFEDVGKAQKCDIHGVFSLSQP